MIARICGKIIKRCANSLLIDLSGLSYEVYIPTAIMSRLDEGLADDGTIKLVTYHYHNVEPSRSVPILIGFLNEVERDFFQQFITVSGIGPKAALKALAQPISIIAKAIDEGDIDFLKSLPGIGQQRAREIVAKLQGKVGKFALIQDADTKIKKSAVDDIESEAIEILAQLQYKRQEAKEMVRKAYERFPDAATTEELLNEVYRQRMRK